MFSQIFLILFAAQQVVSIHVHVNEKHGETVAMEVDAKGGIAATTTMATPTKNLLTNEVKNELSPGDDSIYVKGVQFQDSSDNALAWKEHQDSWKDVEILEEECGGGKILGWWFLFPWSVFRSLGTTPTVRVLVLHQHDNSWYYRLNFLFFQAFVRGEQLPFLRGGVPYMEQFLLGEYVKL